MIDDMKLLSRLADIDPYNPDPTLAEAITARLLAEMPREVPVRPVPKRRRRAQLAALTAAALSIVTLGVGNVAYADASPPTVPATALPSPAELPIAGTFVPVAQLSSTVPMTLALAADPTGRSYGCVTMVGSDQRAPATLPDDPRDTSIPNTLCAFKTAGASPGPGLGYEDVLNPAQPNLGAVPLVAFGYAPAATAKVVIRLSKRGPILFRLLKPTTTVTAGIYGAQVRTPLLAWEGPDLSGYSVVSITAINGNGTTLARLSF